MAVQGYNMRIASFYCREKDGCCTSKMFGDFSSRPFPNIVADLQIKDVLLEAMKRINDVTKKQSKINHALIFGGIFVFLVTILVVFAFSGTETTCEGFLCPSTDTKHTNSTQSTPTGHKNDTLSETNTYKGPVWLLLLFGIIGTTPGVVFFVLNRMAKRDCKAIVEEYNRKRKY